MSGGDPFGAATGKVDDLTSQGLKNSFDTIPHNDISTFIDSNRVQPRQMGSGVMRGTQTIMNVDGSYITLGEIPTTNGDFGFGFFDRDGNLIFKMTGTSQTLYNTNSEVYTLDDDGFTFSDATDKRIRIGKAPDDGRIGDWQSKTGEDVVEQLGGT